MIKYLTRYLTGGPISNSRIVGERDGRIYFMARSKKKGSGQTMTSLAAVEFVQQWCLHILPKEFTKTRQYGAWSGSKRQVYLEQCRSLARTVRKGPSAEQSEADGVGQRREKDRELSGSPEAHADAFIAKNRCGAWWWSVARVGGSCSMVRIIQAGLSGQAEGCVYRRMKRMSR